MLDFVGHGLTGLARLEGDPVPQCARDPGSSRYDFSSGGNEKGRQLSDSVIHMKLEQFKTFLCRTPHNEL